MNTAELRNKSITELKETLSATRRSQFKLRLVKGSGELTHAHKLKEVRRDIAQILTILAEKEGNRNE